MAFTLVLHKLELHHYQHLNDMRRQLEDLTTEQVAAAARRRQASLRADHGVAFIWYGTKSGLRPQTPGAVPPHRKVRRF